MKTKKALLTILITTLVITVMLISLWAYYVAIALFVGAVLLCHREIWSLITKRKLPPFDERTRGNVGKAVRNGFIFLILALAFLMLPFTQFFNERPDMSQILAGLFLAGGATYLLSYIYYDRSQPNLGEKGLKTLKAFLITAGVSVAAFILGVFLHNLFYALFDLEEPVFFIIAVVVAPAGLVVGIIGSFAVFLKGLFKKASTQ
ncbi:MAG: hypothetical protein JW967_01760 [Dehalococcoidales bacterium]|nr:hypothetical protein [Dehalococcoidales bacterium]